MHRTEFFPACMQNGHICQLHDDPRSLTAEILTFAAEGLQRRHPVMLISRKPRLDAVKEQLRAQGLPVERHLQQHTLQLVDAEALLPQLLDDGSPDSLAFTRFTDKLFSAAAWSETSPYIYGDMVNLLWRQERPEAAIKLEEFWNELARKRSFYLFCGYEIATLDPCSYHQPLAEIARCHGAVFETLEDSALQKAIDSACTDVLGVPLSASLCYHALQQPAGEHRLSSGRRSMQWMQRNMPEAMGKVLSRARHLYAQDTVSCASEA